MHIGIVSDSHDLRIVLFELLLSSRLLLLHYTSSTDKHYHYSIALFDDVWQSSVTPYLFYIPCCFGEVVFLIFAHDLYYSPQSRSRLLGTNIAHIG